MKRIFPVVCGVYRIICTPTKKVYIGSSKDIHVRWRAHLNDFRNNENTILLQRAWNKYGKDKFVFEVIEEVPFDLLYSKEQYWINFYDAANHKKGFNMLPFAGNPSGRIVSEETRIKLGKAAKGRLAWNKGKRTIKYGICVICQKKFKKKWRREAVKTCSIKCHKALMRKMIYDKKKQEALVILVCFGCGKNFIVKRYKSKNRKYCSFPCYRKFANKDHQVTKICRICRHKFTIRKIWKNVVKMCSKKCRLIWMDSNITFRKCPLCKKNFKIRSYATKICCSKRCAGFYRGITK